MSNHDLSAQELATEVTNGLHGQGHREQRQSLKVSRQKYRNIMSVIAQRKETTMTLTWLSALTLIALLGTLLIWSNH